MDRKLTMSLVAILLAIVAIDTIGGDHQLLQGAGILAVAGAALLEGFAESKAGPMRVIKYALAVDGLILYLVSRHGPAT